MSRATVTEAGISYVMGILRQNPHATNKDIAELTGMNDWWVNRTSAEARRRIGKKGRGSIFVPPRRYTGSCTCKDQSMKACPPICILSTRAGFSCPAGGFPSHWQGPSTPINAAPQSKE